MNWYQSAMGEIQNLRLNIKTQLLQSVKDVVSVYHKKTCLGEQGTD